MDNGTLMLNGTDYSSGKGTLIVNGVVYSGGGSGGEIMTIDYYLVVTKSIGQNDASLNIIHKRWNKTDKTTTVIATETLGFRDASTERTYFDVLSIKYENLNWHIKNIVKTTEFDINTEFGTWQYNEVNNAVTTIVTSTGGSGSGEPTYRILNNPSNTYTSSGTFAPWEKYGDIPDIEISSDLQTITCNFSGTFDLRIPYRFERGASTSTTSTQIVVYVNDVLSRSITVYVTPNVYNLIEVEELVVREGDNIKIGKVNDGKGYLYLYSVEFIGKQS